MNFKFTKDPIEKLNADLVFVVCSEKESEKPIPASLQNGDGGQDLDKIFGGQISQMIRTEQFSGKEGEALLIHTFGKIKARAILVVGAGNPKNYSLETLRRIGGRIAQCANSIKAISVGGVAESTKIKGIATTERIQALTEGLLLSHYNFDQYKQKEKSPPKTLANVVFQTKINPAPLQKGVAMAQTFVQAANLTRDLTNRPANDVTPTVLAKMATALAKEYKNISVKVLGLKEIKAQKMGGILAVTQGSVEPPAFIHLVYTPPKKSKTKVALVGKGITFDSGGLNIKTRDMEFMKIDMGGAATVLGVFQALATMKLPVQVEGFIASCENMPSGTAIRPGDIITTRAGRTVEIINTDAEGRLVLADALDYACDTKPTYIIDMATLTGGAAYALGELCTPVLGNDQRLIDKILAAGKKAGEPAWQLPLMREYKKGYLKGPADLKNSGSGSRASTISGALFLEDFAKKNKWAHMDIASTCWADEPTSYYTQIGATGIPVRTLLNFLMNS